MCSALLAKHDCRKLAIAPGKLHETRPQTTTTGLSDFRNGCLKACSNAYLSADSNIPAVQQECTKRNASARSTCKSPSLAGTTTCMQYLQALSPPCTAACKYCHQQALLPASTNTCKDYMPYVHYQRLMCAAATGRWHERRPQASTSAPGSASSTCSSERGLHSPPRDAAHPAQAEAAPWSQPRTLRWDLLVRHSLHRFMLSLRPAVCVHQCNAAELILPRDEHTRHRQQRACGAS